MPKLWIDSVTHQEHTRPPDQFVGELLSGRGGEIDDWDRRDCVWDYWLIQLIKHE
jgi:hypothetical protein